MRISIPQLLNLGVSGFTMVGDDIGGFNGSPEPDLLTRWIELGSFNPIDLDHTGIGIPDQEPWADGPEQEPIRKHYINVRYRLMPYIYTAAEESSRDGLPIMRPMYLEFPVGMETEESEFMFGPSLLIAPQPLHTRDDYQMNFPHGTQWYDYWTGRKLDPLQSTIIKPRLDMLPVYVRAGAVIPEQPVVQSTDEIPNGPLELHVYPGPGCHGSLYADDGKSFDYKKGQFLRESFTCAAIANGLDIHITRQGSYQPWWKQVQLIVYGAPHAPHAVQLDRVPVENTLFDEKTAAVRFTIDTPKENSTIHIAN